MADRWPLSIDGLLMDDTPDAEGVRWRVNGVDGWDSPPVRTDDEDRTGQHGGYGSPRLYGARLLTVNGRAHCPDMAAAFRVRDRLHGLLGMDGPVVLEVLETPAKQLAVVAGGPPRSSWPREGGLNRVVWQLPLLAHDPFKRATTSTTTPLAAASSVTIPQAGTATADLTITVTSPGTVVLSAGGLALTTSALPAGAVIDTAACTIESASGADLFATVAAGSQWPALPKGGGVVAQAGTAALSVTHFDTYA